MMGNFLQTLSRLYHPEKELPDCCVLGKTDGFFFYQNIFTNLLTNI